MDISGAAKLPNGTSVGTTSGAPLNLATTGDQIFAYDTNNVPTSNANQSGFIAAIGMNGPWDSDATSDRTSALPSIFNTLANSHITPGTEHDNAVLDCNATNTITKGSPAALRASIHNEANWILTNVDAGTPLQPSNCGFEVVYVWKGLTSDWNTAGNWEGDTAPTLNDDILITSSPIGGNYPTNSTGVSFNDMTIESGATFITTATTNGTITFNKNIANTNWHLISSPVSGETFTEFNASHTLATGGSGNVGFAPYNTTTNTWDYYTNSTVANLNDGQGYSLKLAAAGGISFTGDANSGDIQYTLSSGTSNFNLLGNPFTAYFNSGLFLTENTSNLTEETIWVWDGSQYLTYAKSQFHMIPAGEAFFVEASSSAMVNFDADDQSHFSTALKTATEEFTLSINNGTSKKSTKISFVEDKTCLLYTSPSPRDA